MSDSHIPAALRQLIYHRAKGQCEYCLIPEAVSFAAHQVDHIIAQKHGGLTDADNLALACTLCNKHKGTDLASLDPETGELVRLYDPRHDQWNDHFQLNGPYIIALTSKGRVTIRLLQLNRPECISERETLITAGVALNPA